MNDLVTTVCYGVFFLSTVFFLRRAGYSWVAAVLAGVFSPLAFIVLFAMLALPLSLFVGMLGIPDHVLPQDVLSAFAAAIVIVGWCMGGFFISRRPTQGPPAQRKSEIGCAEQENGDR